MSKITKNTAIYTIGSILPKAAGLILLPLYTKYLSPEQYGVLSSMWVLESILMVFFSLSFGSSIFRLYWDYKTEEERKKFLGTMFMSMSGMGLVCAILLFAFQNFIDGIYSGISFYPYFLYSIITVFISNLFDLPQKVLMLKDRALHYVMLSVGFFTINSSLIIYFVIYKEQGAAGYMLSTLITTILFLPFYLYITFKNVTLHFSSADFKSMLFFSLPILPTLLSSWVLDLSDRIFIEKYFSLTEVGIYSLAYKISGIVLIISGGFNLAFRPAFFKLSNSENQVEAQDMIYKFNNAFLLVLLIFFFLLCFFTKEIILLFFDAAYSTAYLYVPIICFSYFLSVIGGVIARYFEQSKKMKINMYIYIAGALLNIVFNFILIPHMGAYGAAFSTVLSMLFVVSISYYYSKKKCYFVKLNINLFLIITASLTTIFLLFDLLLNTTLVTALIVKIVFIAIVSAILIKKYYGYVITLYKTLK